MKKEDDVISAIRLGILGKPTGSYMFKTVLRVPNLACNLLPASKLTKESNCIAKFSDSC
ncbi:hypothetical protein CK203_046455 [Vitis vinifera]|uniref:Uncharacterized protein n=1 Tax=Vitis vinifera TaxID=29760 RepID=A0A438I207_VITVI|nr:hypothetical protein CK203_046455 [Vitis vinifera]